MTDKTLIENFQEYFSVTLAGTPEQKKKVFGIRYRVYCEEFKYEPVDRFPDELEYDTYDDHSLHCLITHNKTQIPASCVRMIPTTGEHGKDPLPFEKYCQESLNHDLIKRLDLNRQTVCEISRLAVDGYFRRRSGEKLTRYGGIDSMDVSHKEKRTFSLIAVASFLAANALGELSGRTNGFAMMETFLPRLMKRSGIQVQRVGKDVNYHGIRAPYFNNSRSALEKMHPDLQVFYQWIREEIKATYDMPTIENFSHEKLACD